jgi:uncharacterized integral membrane protein
MGYLVVAVVAVAVAIFAMQNTMPVTVSFLAWRFEEVPLAAVVLVSLAAGIVLIGVPLWFKVWRLRNRLHAVTAATAAAPEPAATAQERPDVQRNAEDRGDA